MGRKGKDEYYVDPKLKPALVRVKRRITKQDADYVLVIDGPEGSGKSVLAMQVGKHVDPTLTLDRVCMTPDEFRKAIIKAKPHQCVIFDEAYIGLSSRASLSAINKILISKMMEMRQKNLFVIIVIPTIFLLDRYVALFRSQALLHLYESRERRGYWIGFNRKNKKILYLKGRKTMSYDTPYIYNFKGRFYGKYALDEQEYRKKKAVALAETEKTETESPYKWQRDYLLWFIHEFYEKSSVKLAERFKKVKKERKFILAPQNISKSIKKIRENP